MWVNQHPRKVDSRAILLLIAGKCNFSLGFQNLDYEIMREYFYNYAKKLQRQQRRYIEQIAPGNIIFMWGADFCEMVNQFSYHFAIFLTRYIGAGLVRTLHYACTISFGIIDGITFVLETGASYMLIYRILAGSRRFNDAILFIDNNIVNNIGGIFGLGGFFGSSPIPAILIFTFLILRKIMKKLQENVGKNQKDIGLALYIAQPNMLNLRLPV